MVVIVLLHVNFLDIPYSQNVYFFPLLLSFWILTAVFLIAISKDCNTTLLICYKQLSHETDRYKPYYVPKQ